MNTLNKAEGFKVTEPIKFTISIIVGMAMGMARIPDIGIAALYFILSCVTVFFAIQNNLEKLFFYIPFMVYGEIYYRTNGNYLPYLLCVYVLLGVFALLLLHKGSTFKIYSIHFIFLFLFCLVEVLDSFRTTNVSVARSLIMQNLLMFIVTFWACSTMLSPRLINILIKNLKMAGLWICGYILSAHITGQVNYSSGSSFESTGGLAPVQISAYLGLICFLFFITITNNTDNRNITSNIIFLIISAVLMILSFSRGGLYFFGVLVTIYFIWNRKQINNFYLLFVLLPIGYIIYYYVVTATGGLVAERYSQQGTSGRDLLVEIGFKLFLENPVGGVGTGNFNKLIVESELYSVESGAHNEFIRVIAEHGLLGILTYWAFYIFLFIKIMLAKGTRREYSLYFFVLFCLIIIHNGLKISLQPIILLLALSICQITPKKVIARR